MSSEKTLPAPGMENARADSSEIARTVRDYLEKARVESRRVVEEATNEIVALKTRTERELQEARDALERRARELDEARETLETDLRALEERARNLETESFEKAKVDGYQAGLQVGTGDGYQAGLKKAESEFAVRVAESMKKELAEAREEALKPLLKLAREMSCSRQALLKNWEENIMQIAAAIAYQTILREPVVAREASIELLREALDLAMNCATLKIRMNPGDVDALRDQIRVVLEETGNLAKSEVVADPKISRGGCLVETSLGVVDERLESRLERIVAELSE